MGLLIGRYDHKDATGKRVLWSLPKGHIEEGETPEQAAIREVAEETGITSTITKSLGVIDFWFMAGGKRIHKTVHHFMFTEVGGTLLAQESEVDEVSWFPLSEIVDRLAYPDEKKLIARSAELTQCFWSSCLCRPHKQLAQLCELHQWLIKHSQESSELMIWLKS
jgi:ADP-ribose pyrophosphatase YjhB (NUDIX family)